MFRLIAILICVPFVALAQAPTPPSPSIPADYPSKVGGPPCRAITFVAAQLAAIQSRLDQNGKPDQEVYQDPLNPGRFLVQFGTKFFYDVDGNLTRTEPIETEIEPGDYIYFPPDATGQPSDSIRVMKRPTFEAKCDVTP